jgi:hypothetical protein
VGLILGACITLPCFLPLATQSIRSIIEATIERKTAAHVMMLWKYKPLNKPGKCSLTLDASRIIQGTQQTEFPPDATTTFSQQLALSKMKSGTNHQPLLLGTSQISKFQPDPF